ncbi:MAG TPA: 3-oxoadipate enol-lactonase [Mucilaginibacter sp.]|jgi:3-oxoadipate enol-lactonase/4-carboxymuconolactone decarboxylase
MDFINCNGVNIHYKYTRGDGDCAFLFINSLGTDLRIWDGVVDELKLHGSVLCFDKMGHGLSEVAERDYKIADYAADIIELMDALNIGKVTLIGLSIGGVIAQYMGIHHADRIERLVISNSAPKVGTVDGWETRINKVKTDGISAIAEGILKVWFSEHFRENRQAELAGYRQMLCNGNPAGYIKACEALKGNDLSAEISDIKLPTLFIAGSEDGSVPPATVKEAADKIPGSEFIEVAGVGHIPCAEKSVLVAEIILKFVSNTQCLSLYDLGMKTRRSVLGDEHVNLAEANKTAFDSDFQEYITNSAWGAIWSRPGLTKRERSMITIAVLAALKLDHELAMHIKATKSTGATPEDVKEVLMHTGVYAGVPVTNGAMKIAKEIFSKE